MSLQQIDINALIRLKACCNDLTHQQYKTLRGQVFAGDSTGAMKGLQNILARCAKQN